jgi:hypothetical protein
MNHPRLKRVFKEILNELENNPQFSARVAQALGDVKSSTSGRRRGRRSPAVVDPIKTFDESGESGLRSALAKLDLEMLRDIVAEFGMDPAKLVMKWVDPTRVIDHVVANAAVRAKKGDAFR